MSAETFNLSSEISNRPNISRRRELLPWWLLLITALFIIIGAVIPVSVIEGIFKSKFHITLLGISIHDPLSPICIVSTLFYFYKVFVAYTLWTEKDWALKVAVVDATFSIALCCVAIWYAFVTPQVTGSSGLNLASDLFLTIIYLVKINKIQPAWENFGRKTDLQYETESFKC